MLCDVYIQIIHVSSGAICWREISIEYGIRVLW